MSAGRRLYVKQWDHQPAKERYSVQIKYGGKRVQGVQPKRISQVEEEVMRWRKANHIHAWFVDNVQNGTDELRELLSSYKKVIEASKLVDGTIDAGTVYNQEHPDGLAQRTPGKVIKDSTVAERLLPTRGGFFFGCTEYDEDYLDEVVRTRDWIVSMLDDLKNGVPGEICYRSSW